MRHTSIATPLIISDNVCLEEMYVGYSLSKSQFVSVPEKEEIRPYSDYPLKEESFEHFLDPKKLKVLIHFRSEFFHMFVDTFTDIFRIHNLNPEALFVIYIDKNKVTKSSVDFAAKVLGFSGVQYVFVDILYEYAEYRDALLVAKMRNFYSLPQVSGGVLLNEACLSEFKHAVDMVKNALKESGSAGPTPPKIYLSRSKVGYHTLLNPEVYSGYKTDARIGGSGEAEVEKYLSSLDFTIVYPEDFSSLEEQILFMSGVDILVAPTGSGLINAAFMEDNKTVVEIKCELLFGDTFPGDVPAYQVLISEYSDISYIKGHTHIAVSNNGPDKSAQDVIEKLGSSTLRHLLCPAPTHIT